MAKRGSENQDYYKLRGGEVGRRMFAEDRAKLKIGTESPRVATRPKATRAKKPAVSAEGAGVETAKRAKKRKVSKSRAHDEEEVRQEIVDRMVDAHAHAAPANRQLPPAERATAVADFLRTLREDLDTIDRSARALVASLVDLARTPARLLRLMRTVRAT
ncbi:MAG: hypothetical protein ACOX6T_20325 [Myxococcales bacterium]|jgi:hypothetical protein